MASAPPTATSSAAPRRDEKWPSLPVRQGSTVPTKLERYVAGAQDSWNKLTSVFAKIEEFQKKKNVDVHDIVEVLCALEESKRCQDELEARRFAPPGDASGRIRVLNGHLEVCFEGARRTDREGQERLATKKAAVCDPKQLNIAAIEQKLDAISERAKTDVTKCRQEIERVTDPANITSGHVTEMTEEQYEETRNTAIDALHGTTKRHCQSDALLADAGFRGPFDELADERYLPFSIGDFAEEADNLKKKVMSEHQTFEEKRIEARHKLETGLVELQKAKNDALSSRKEVQDVWNKLVQIFTKHAADLLRVLYTESDNAQLSEEIDVMNKEADKVVPAMQRGCALADTTIAETRRLQEEATARYERTVEECAQKLVGPVQRKARNSKLAVKYSSLTEENLQRKHAFLLWKKRTQEDNIRELEEQKRAGRSRLTRPQLEFRLSQEMKALKAIEADIEVCEADEKAMRQRIDAANKEYNSLQDIHKYGQPIFEESIANEAATEALEAWGDLSDLYLVPDEALEGSSSTPAAGAPAAIADRPEDQLAKIPAAVQQLIEKMMQEQADLRMDMLLMRDAHQRELELLRQGTSATSAGEESEAPRDGEIGTADAGAGADQPVSVSRNTSESSFDGEFVNAEAAPTPELAQIDQRRGQAEVPHVG